MAEIIQSSKGKPLLNYEGYLYNRFEIKLNGAITTWRCTNRCGGWVTQCGTEFQLTKQHNHNPSPTTVEVRKVKESLKARAVSHPYEKASVTIAEIRRGTSVNAAPHLPAELSMKSTINRVKRENHKQQITGKTRKDLVIPPELLLTNRGANFLAYDSADSDRILIFSTERNLMELGLANIWMVDGTFKVAPNLYTQIFTVHAPIDGWILPLVFAILPDKKASTYEKLWENLRKASLGHISTPEIIITDFEAAQIASIHNVFETASIQGCFFHFSQSLQRNLPKEVVTLMKAGDKDLELIVKKFAAFAFLPPNHVNIIFDEFKKIVLQEKPCIKPFVRYFEETYVGNLIHGPLFNVKIWSVYHRVLADFPRTNNAVEGYNNRLNNMVNASHPCLSTLLRLFKDEQSKVEDCLQIRLAGGDPPPRIEKYAILNSRIVKLVRGYEYSQRWDFLTGISFNLMKIKSVKKGKPLTVAGNVSN